MLFLVLVLFGFCSSVCEQFQLEAADGANITLQWDNGLSIAPSDLILYCFHLPSAHGPSRMVLEVAQGQPRPGSTRGQFSGRVWWDREVLDLGQVRILLTQVSAQDQGRFWCYIYGNYHPPTSRWNHTSSEFFTLTVTRPKPTETRPGAAERGFSGLKLLRTLILGVMFTCMTLMAVAIVLVGLCGGSTDT